METLKDKKIEKLEFLGTDQPLPLTDVLKTLIKASESLLHRYNYDGYNHEEIQECISRGKEIIESINKYLSEIFLNEQIDTAPTMRDELFKKLWRKYYVMNFEWEYVEHTGLVNETDCKKLLTEYISLTTAKETA